VLRSMTAFASAKGNFGQHSWSWEIRSVNGKGLDLRLRVPDWVEGLEAGLRVRLGKALSRGNVTLNLRIQSEEGTGTLNVNPAQVENALDAVSQIESRAAERGLSLVPTTAVDILSLRGVLETGTENEDTSPLCKAVLADFEPLLDSFLDMRKTEGSALARILEGQLDEIADLTDKAAATAKSRQPEMVKVLKNALARVLDNADGLDPDRVAQELALISVKADVTEEIDRLRTHVSTAKDLISKGSPIGRKFDFLSQEFNREANTLCSKAQNSELTTIGLELKTVIDQMREQVQNLE